MERITFRKAVKIDNIPPADSITDIVIEPGHGESATIEEFLKIYRSAVQIFPEKPEDWHYTPWFSGSFNYNDRKYRFIMFLGGRGLLGCPDGTKGLFLYKIG